MDFPDQQDPVRRPDPERGPEPVRAPPQAPVRELVLALVPPQGPLVGASAVWVLECGPADRRLGSLQMR